MRDAAFYIAPKGELMRDWFPGLSSLPGAILEWQKQAQEKYDVQEAQEHHVYFRAYKHIARRLNAEYSTADVEMKGRFRRVESQMQYFEQEAQRHSDAIQDATAETTAVPRSRSRVVSKAVRW